jgi:hypothetical protein
MLDPLKDRDAASGLFLFLLSISMCIMAFRLGLGSWANPGPGFASFGIACLLGFLSIILSVKAMVRRIGEKERISFAKEKGFWWVRPVFILLILVGYGFFLNLFGFSFSNFLLMTFLVWGIARQRLKLALIVSILTTVAAYLLFIKLLGLPLPSGSIWPG